MQIACAEDVHQITEHAAGHRADASLQENVGRTSNAHCRHLLYRFIGEGGVTLHNPGRDFGITFPGGVLYHFPAVLPGGLHREAYGIVIVHLGDDTPGAKPQDGINALLGRTFGHIDDGILSQLLCRPRHAASVVTVGGGGKGHLFFDAGFEGCEGKCVDIQVIFFAQQLCDSVGAAQHFECVQTETLRLVFDQNRTYAEQSSQRFEGIQRRRFISDDFLMKMSCLLRLLARKQRGCFAGKKTVFGNIHFQ